MGEVYFYANASPFSNFYKVPGGILHEGVQLPTSEHHLMYQKAHLMKDYASARAIKRADTPAKAKRLGRKVKPWDQSKWEACREDIMTAILVSKFEDPQMRPLLLETGDSPIYEASPKDNIWGIGISVQRAKRGAKHKGRNLLGKCLMRAREEIRSADI